MPSETSFLPAHLPIEPELSDQLGSRPGHQRCLEGDGELLLITHEVPRPAITEREALFFWKRRDGRWIGPQASGGLADLDALLDRYARAIDGHDGVLVTATAAEVFALLRHAGPLVGSLRNLVAALEQTLAIEHDDKAIRSICDRARELELAAELLDADARLALEFLKARHLEEQALAIDGLNRRVGRIHLLVGIFLPVLALGVLLILCDGIPFFVRNGIGGILILLLIAAMAVWVRNTRPWARLPIFRSRDETLR